MPTFSAFDRSTLKLFIAAFFVLGGANVATAWAQEVAANPLLGLRGVVLDPSTSPMSAESLAVNPTCVVYGYGNRALIQGAVLHDDPHGPTAAAVEVTDSNGHGELHAVTAGAGGFFYLDVIVPAGPFAIHVAAAGQRDAMSVCTHPDIAPAPGLGLGSVSISNSTDQTAANVQQSVDAYNLF